MSQTKCYKYDFIVIGAGMSGIAFVIEAISKNPDLKIALIEKGKFLQDRICPIAKSGKCKKCKTCSIMSGFAGAGAFSDAKFNISTEYGGWINDYMSDDNAIFYMNKLDKILCKYIDEDYKKYKPNITINIIVAAPYLVKSFLEGQLTFFSSALKSLKSASIV